MTKLNLDENQQKKIITSLKKISGQIKRRSAWLGIGRSQSWASLYQL
jgi:transcriptional regulator of acetoin/glycerol metabolism